MLSCHGTRVLTRTRNELGLWTFENGKWYLKLDFVFHSRQRGKSRVSSLQVWVLMMRYDDDAESL